MNNVKVISFDMDGTLVDPKFVDLVWNFGVPDLLAKKEGIDFKEAKKYTWEEYEKVGENSIKWYDIKYWFDFFDLDESYEDLIESLSSEIKIYSEVPKVLEKLVKNYKLIIASNAAREFLDIEMQNIKDYFSHSFSSTSDFKLVKKTPSFYKNICEILGISPEEMVHVGDHWNFDVVSPKKLGVTAFYLNRDEKSIPDNGYDFVVNNLEGILEWL